MFWLQAPCFVYIGEHIAGSTQVRSQGYRLSCPTLHCYLVSSSVVCWWCAEGMGAWLGSPRFQVWGHQGLRTGMEKVSRVWHRRLKAPSNLKEMQAQQIPSLWFSFNEILCTRGLQSKKLGVCRIFMFTLPDHSPCCCMTGSCHLWPYHLGSTPFLAWASFWPVEAVIGSQGQEGENWVFLPYSLPAELRVIGGCARQLC